MSTSNSRRFNNEAKQIELNRANDANLFVVTATENMSKWNAIIYGPEGSMYYGYQFDLSIELPADYPTSPMIVKFKTPISHVNVNKHGDICLDVLKQNWTPILNIRSILISLISLLSDPNPDDPLNSDLAVLFRENKEKYKLKIMQDCEKQAVKRK